MSAQNNNKKTKCVDKPSTYLELQITFLVKNQHSIFIANKGFFLLLNYSVYGKCACSTFLRFHEFTFHLQNRFQSLFTVSLTVILPVVACLHLLVKQVQCTMFRKKQF